MKLGWIITICIAAVAALGCMYALGIRNEAAQLLNTITATEKLATGHHDNMWKKISQVVQVTKAERESLEKIMIGYADARTQRGDNAPIMNWIKETVPQVDNSTFRNLQNIITGSRDSWMVTQTDLNDKIMQYNSVLQDYPKGWFLQKMGFEFKEYKVISSTRSREAMDTGVDDDVDLGLSDKPKANPER
jgi:hypothetical protein